MTRLILSSLSLLLVVGATVSAVRAQETAENTAKVGTSRNYIYQITPFNLAEQAYRGYFKDQGIPSYDRLSVSYNEGKVTALDLVKSAIQANRLSPQTLNDRGYLNAVDDQLRSLANQD
jgi:hypothetical protein